MPTDTIVIQPNRAVATQVVYAGEGPTLVKNADLINTVFLGDDDSIKPGDPNGVIPLGPNASVTVDGTRDLFAVNGNPAAVTVITLSGGLSNFLGLTQGQGSLAIPSVFSPNFITGVSGWTIKQDGSAEFNNLSIRGTFFGLNFILNSSGLFFYSGTPANGNLLMYWSLVSGTDSFGNTITKTLTIGNPTGSTPQIALVPAPGGPGTAAQLQFPLFPSNFFLSPPNIAGSSPGNSGLLFISGSALAQVGFQDSVQDIFGSFNAFGLGNAANRRFNYIDTNSITHTFGILSANGFNLSVCQNINGIHPGTGTNNTNAGVPETWQTLALLNGWQSGGPIPGGVRICYNPINGGRIDVEADIFHSTIALPATSTFAQLPAVYLALVNGAAFRRNFPAMSNYNFANNSPSTNWGWYDGAGNLQIINYEAHVETAFQGYIPLT